MSEQIQELIEKIQQEGVFAAEEKARQIEDQARKQAEAIIAKARAEANNLLELVKNNCLKLEESTQASLKQASRDMLISLRKEINALLEKVTAAHIKEALKPEELAKIILGLIKDYSAKEKEEIIISAASHDLEKLEKALFSHLKDKIRQGVTLKPSEEISSGFLISYDAGKSYYDFSDKAITGYIGTYLKPKLAEILRA